MAVVDPEKELQKVLKAVEAKFGKGVIHNADETVPVFKLPFLSPNMNYATEGGLGFGRMASMYGDPSCLSASTFLSYQIRNADGRIQNSKGGSIERLYHRFNGITMAGKGAYQRPQTIGAQFYLPSMDEDGFILQNRVVDVIDSGVKKCVSIKTASGMVIETTVDHRFFSNGNFLPAGELYVGDLVTIHNRTRAKIDSCGRRSRPETTVKHHGVIRPREINGYMYCRIRRSRLVYEANMNGLSVDEYKRRLNDNELDGLSFLSVEDHVHHIDEVANNDVPENLQVLDPVSHGKVHGIVRQNALSYIVVDDTIVSIEPVGERHTYDITMESPYNNFVADGFVVHNSGKTRNAYELIAQLQGLPGTLENISIPRIDYHTSLSNETIISDDLRRSHEMRAAWLTEEIEWVRANFPHGGDAVFYNAEQQFDPKYAETIGIDTSRLKIVDSTVIEEICEIMQGLLPHYCMHVIDSTSYASSNLQLKEDVGKSLYAVDARQWKSSLKPTMTYFDKTLNIGLMIHQMSTNMRTGGQDPNSTKFMRFASSLSIKFERGKFLWLKDGVLIEDKATGADKESMAGRAEPDGVQVFAKIEKSRTCRPFRVAGLQFKYRKPIGYVHVHDLAQSGLYFGLVQQSGSWFKVAGEAETLGQGLKTVYARLADDEELRGRIMCRLLDTTVD